MTNDTIPRSVRFSEHPIERIIRKHSLAVLLGLNMDAYAADIGRLTLAEASLDQGYSP